MPYLTCPGCRMSVYSVAHHYSVADTCPNCDAALGAAAHAAGLTRRWRVIELRVSARRKAAEHDVA